MSKAFAFLAILGCVAFVVVDKSNLLEPSDCEVWLEFHAENVKVPVDMDGIIEVVCRPVKGGIQQGSKIGDYVYWDRTKIPKSLVDLIRYEKDGTLAEMDSTEIRQLEFNLFASLLGGMF